MVQHLFLKQSCYNIYLSDVTTSFRWYKISFYNKAVTTSSYPPAAGVVEVSDCDAVVADDETFPLDRSRLS